MEYNINDITFLPLDLKDLELPNFYSVFEEECKIPPDINIVVHSNGIADKETSHINYWAYWSPFLVRSGGWHPRFLELYPQAVSFFNELPYEEIYRIYFFKQIKDVDPHADIVTGLYTSYPSAMRYWVVNDELNSTFYFDNGVKKKFPTYPETSKWFIMNSTSVKHGSYMPKGKKIIMGIYGKPDFARLSTLVDKSMKKYSDYAIMGTDL